MAFVARDLNSRNHAPTGPYASLNRTGMNRTSWHVISAPAFRVKYAEEPEFHGGYQARPMPSPELLALNTYTLFSRTEKPMAPAQRSPSINGPTMNTRSKICPTPLSRSAFFAASA